MTDESDQKESHEGNKDVSEKETIEKTEEIENEENAYKEEIPEAPEKDKIKTQKLKTGAPFKIILFLLLIGSLSWLIYYSYNIIQNNLMITHKIDETIQGINRIQIEQDKIKEEIKSFQNKNNSTKPQPVKVEINKKIFSVLHKLSKEVSVLQNEVKVLQVEIKKKPKSLPLRQVQVVEIPPKKPQSVKAEIKEEPKIKETTEIKEEPVANKESNADARSRAINFIEDSVKTAFKEIGNAFEWIKGKVL